MGVAKQIIGSFEDIGKDIIREAASVPKDIAGKALESLGTSSGQKTQKPVTNGPWEQFDALPDKDIKKKMARNALQALLARLASKPKEPTVWEKIQQETEQKKQLQQQQQVQANASQLTKTASKRPRGDLYGVGVKKLGSEVGKNVRQD
ncbi:MAG: hypothetical protein AAB457_04005 [Patescibacteria group bacterium]